MISFGVKANFWKDDRDDVSAALTNVKSPINLRLIEEMHV